MDVEVSKLILPPHLKFPKNVWLLPRHAIVWERKVADANKPITSIGKPDWSQVL